MIYVVSSVFVHVNMYVCVHQGKSWCLCTGSMVWFPESVQMNCWRGQKVLISSERARDNQELIHLLWGTCHLFFILSLHVRPSVYPSKYIMLY